MTSSRGSRSAAPRSSPSTRTTRVFNGFATPLDARALAIVQRDPDVGASSRCGRRSRRRRTRDDRRHRRRRRRAPARRRDPGFSARGSPSRCSTPGSTSSTRTSAGALLRGLDVLDPVGDASARQNPTAPGRPERHGTEMAGLVAGSGGPAGLQGVAPGSRAAADPRRRLAAGRVGRGLRLRPHRPAAGRDRARRRSERGRRRPRRRPGDARRRRRALRRLRRRPARGRRRGSRRARLARHRRRPGTTGRPGRRTAASAGRAGRLPRSPSARSTRAGAAPPATSCCSPGSACSSRASSRSAASSRPALSVSAPVVALPRCDPAVVGAAGGLTRLFDTSGYSRVGGAAVLLPRGHVVARGRSRGRRRRRARRPRRRAAPGRVRSAPTVRPTYRSSGSPQATPTPFGRRSGRAIPSRSRSARLPSTRTPSAATAAPFSSEGLAFDGGPKPEVSAAGDRSRDVGSRTQRGRCGPIRHAQRLERRRGAHRGSGRPARAGATGSRRRRAEAGARCRRRGAPVARRPAAVDPSGAAAVELVADPPTVGLGVALGRERRRRPDRDATERQPAGARV